MTVTFTGAEAGTLTFGNNAIAFSEIERFSRAASDDIAQGGANTSGFMLKACGGNGGKGRGHFGG